MRRRCWVVVVLVLAGALGAPALADVALPSIVGSNMVVQQGREIPIWGTAETGEEVTVTLGEAKAKATADAKGKWMVKLPAQKAGGEPLTITVAGKNTLTLTNVLVGEVWVCSGQSNMAFGLRGSNAAKTAIPAAKFPSIRLFTVPRKLALEPQETCGGSWLVCDPRTAGGFSAVGYYFGRKIHQELKVPVGLINTSWGGTPAESWTERSFLEARDVLTPIVARWKKIEEDYPTALEAHKQKLAEWQAKVKPIQDKFKADMQAWAAADRKAKADAKAKGVPYKPAPRPARPGQLRPPRGPRGPNSPHYPSSLYNGMIHPLLPFPVQGGIWYQGESNAGRAFQYRTLFPAMIKSWRKVWDDEDLDFYFVQLANFMGVAKDPPAPSAHWAELREAQVMTLALPKTGQAVIIDIGEARDIHPRNKTDVGVRLALSALAQTYGRKIPFAGPTFESMAVQGGAVHVKFKNTSGGLVAKPFADPVTANGPTLAKRFGVPVADLRPKSDVLGFAVAGEDKKFVWATATIEGEDTVVVSSPDVPKPVAVRYAFENNPICNLYGKGGLPASPFRTDTWPGVTDKNR